MPEDGSDGRRLGDVRLQPQRHLGERQNVLGLEHDDGAADAILDVGAEQLKRRRRLSGRGGRRRTSPGSLPPLLGAAPVFLDFCQRLLFDF